MGACFVSNGPLVIKYKAGTEKCIRRLQLHTYSRADIDNHFSNILTQIKKERARGHHQ